MPDWPNPPFAIPTHISAISRYSGLRDVRTGLVAIGSPAAYTITSDLATAVPIRLPFKYVIRRGFWFNGSTITSSNAGVAVYDAQWVRLGTSGGVAMVGASSLQYSAAFASPIEIEAGELFYVAGVYNAATATNRGFGWTTITANAGRIVGLKQMSAAYPLPDPIVPVDYATAQVPLIGITNTASGFA